MNQFVPVLKGEGPVGLANFKVPRVVGMWVGFHVVLGACVMYH